MAHTPPLNSALAGTPFIPNKRPLRIPDVTGRYFVDFANSNPNSNFESSVSPRKTPRVTTPRTPRTSNFREPSAVARPPSTHRTFATETRIFEDPLRPCSSCCFNDLSRESFVVDSDNSSDDQSTSESRLNKLLKACNGDIRRVTRSLPRSGEIKNVSLNHCLVGVAPGEHAAIFSALFSKFPIIMSLRVWNTDLSGACLDEFSLQRDLVALDITGSLRVICETPDRMAPLRLRSLIAADSPFSTNRWHINDDVLNKICHQSSLRLLDISHAIVTDADCLQRLPHLQTLNIEGCASLSSDSCASIAKLKSLEVLNVIGTLFSESDLRVLLDNATELKSLYVSTDQIAIDVLQQLAIRYENVSFFDENKAPIKLDSAQKRIRSAADRALFGS